MADDEQLKPDQAKIAQRGPYIVEVEAGEHWWCRCGRSKEQPFCDGSHEREHTTFEPVAFTLTEKRRVRLCGCKHTKTPPYCDNTHLTLPKT